MSLYGNLKPGLYLQVGTTIKSLETAIADWRHNREQNMAGGLAPGDVESLAAAVTWVFVALDRRKQRISEVPFVWRAGDDSDSTVPPPFDIRVRSLVPRIDEALQLYKAAYLFKQRSGRRMVGLRWLDPAVMAPDYSSWIPGFGIQRYFRTVGARRDTVPAEDLIVFTIAGMREAGPGTPAGQATSLAAQIQFGISNTADAVYDNNALPIGIVEVPRTTMKGDELEWRERIKALFNRSSKSKREYRVEVVRRDAQGEGVKIHPLTMKPADLAMGELEDRTRDQILAAHFVPQSEALSDASNRSVAEGDAARFTTIMGTRFEFIAEEMNGDPELAAFGRRLVPQYHLHPSLSSSERDAAQTFAMLIRGMTPKAAGYVAGIKEEDFPEEIRSEGVFLAAAAAEPMAVSTPGEPAVTKSAKTPAMSNELRLELDRWRRKAKKAIVAGDRDRMVQFDSVVIDPLVRDLLHEALADPQIQTEADIDEIFEFLPA